MSGTVTAETVGKLKQAQRKKATANWSDFRRVLKTLHGGGEIDADKVNEVLESMDMDTDGLKQSLDVYSQRVRLRQKIDQLPALVAKQKEIADRLVEMKPELTRLDALKQEQSRLLYEEHETKLAIGDAETISPMAMVRGCPYPDLRMLPEELRAKETARRKEAKECRRLAGDCQDGISKNMATLEGYREKRQYQSRPMSGETVMAGADLDAPLKWQQELQETIQRQTEIRDAHLQNAGRIDAEADKLEQQAKAAEVAMLEP